MFEMTNWKRETRQGVSVTQSRPTIVTLSHPAIVPDDVTAQADLWYLWYVLHHSSGHEDTSESGETIHYRAIFEKKEPANPNILYQGGGAPCRMYS